VLPYAPNESILAMETALSEKLLHNWSRLASVSSASWAPRAPREEQSIRGSFGEYRLKEESMLRPRFQVLAVLLCLSSPSVQAQSDSQMSAESEANAMRTRAATVAPSPEAEGREAMRPSRGCACTLTAAAESFGLLVRGFGAVSVQKLGTGIYFVTFDRNVANCVYVATIGTPGDQFLMPTGEITVAGVAGFPDSIDVTTHDSAGNFADRGFHVAVHCPPQ
jgi:hypothetical protein